MVCWTASREILPISRVVSLSIKIECFSWVWRFLVSPALGVDCIVGADFISKSGLVLDIQAHHCYFKFNREVVIPFLGYQGANGGIQEVVCPDSERDHLTPSQKHALDHLCEQFPTVLTPNLGLTHLLEYKIRLTDSAVVRSHPYKFAPPKMDVLRAVSYTHLDVYKRQLIHMGQKFDYHVDIKFTHFVSLLINW